ncbi:MAG: zf-HC2 domain-containing protein [Chloroflexia bacterium]|nr:zf-HC2 domain-containing protein [Chloroflexia bacterium]
MSCEQVRQWMLEGTLEGGWAELPAGPFAEHIEGCPDCRAFAARLAAVDAALSTSPLEEAPPSVAQTVLARVSAEARREPETFLSWLVWLPLGSLLLGLFWAYLTLFWQRGSDWAITVIPSMSEWPALLERWLSNQQVMISAVTVCIAAGILFSVLGVGLGLYVGRERLAHGH